jgi:uncharacterized protein YndB with AHSA1/START domain
MAINETYVDAPPDAVFEVLRDPESYAHWVVGASKTRDVSGKWPEPGSKFHHTQGFFGIGLPDNTEVISAEPSRTLVLEARIRPFAVNKVELRMFPCDGGTKLVMVEYPTGGIASLLPSLLTDPPLKLRNVESLRRLRKMAEEGRTR